MTTPTQLTLREVLRIPSVRQLWLAQCISLFGDFLAIFAVYNIVSFRMHGTPWQVSGIMIAYMLPLAIVGPLAGVFVDHWDMKRTMIVSDLVRAVLAIGLIFTHNIYQIYAIFLVMSSVSSFFIPAQSIMLRTVTPPEGLMSANALMQQAMQFVRILSPAVAAGLVSAAGPNSCFYIDGASFVASALFIFSIAASREATQHSVNSVRSALSAMTVGVRYIFTHSSTSFVMVALTAGMFAIGCYTALLAIYVRDDLSAGPGLFGALGSLIGVGVIAGIPIMSRAAQKVSRQSLVITGLAGIGCCVFFLTIVGKIWASIAGTLGIGIFVAFIFVPTQVLMQEATPKEMLGRISSSMMSVMTLSQTIALVFAGSIANVIGVRNLFYVSAALLIGTAALGAVVLRRSPQAA